MLGRTHMSIGAAGAVVAAPLWLHPPQQTLLHWMVSTQTFSSVGLFALFFVAAILGSLLPDLDEQHALASRDLERFMALPMFLMMAALVFLLHLETSLAAWVGVGVLTLAFRAAHNLSRRIGLGVLSLALLYLAWRHFLPIFAAVLLVLWCVGAMWSKHRTFTHSLVGLALLGVGLLSVHTSSSSVAPYLHLAVVGLLLGYVLHLLADAVAGGVPLFWPWSRRLGMRIVQTGSLLDHVIGGLAVCCCVLFFVV